jgi:hypothetical protein
MALAFGGVRDCMSARRLHRTERRSAFAQLKCRDKGFSSKQWRHKKADMAGDDESSQGGLVFDWMGAIDYKLWAVLAGRRRRRRRGRRRRRRRRRRREEGEEDEVEGGGGETPAPCCAAPDLRQKNTDFQYKFYCF